MYSIFLNFSLFNNHWHIYLFSKYVIRLFILIHIYESFDTIGTSRIITAERKSDRTVCFS